VVDGLKSLRSRAVENTAELHVLSRPPAHHPYVVVDLPAELDVASMPELRHHLTTLISSGRVRLVLNAANLDFMDAAGIGSLVYAANQARAAGGWVRLIGVGQKHRRILSILRLGRTLPVHEDLEKLEGALREA
jgi:anti-sigma B factor antagonist